MKSFTKYLKLVFDYKSKKWVKITSNFWNYLQLKSHLQHFIYSYYTKINSFFIPDYMKIPGIMLSIPEKGFLLSFHLFLCFNFLGWQNFELTCTRIFYEIQKSNFCIWTSTSKSIPAPDTHRAYLIAVSAFWCRSLLLSLIFQPRDMHQESPILRYALFHNIQRGVVQQGNPSFDALKL